MKESVRQTGQEPDCQKWNISLADRDRVHYFCQTVAIEKFAADVYFWVLHSGKTKIRNHFYPESIAVFLIQTWRLQS